MKTAMQEIFDVLRLVTKLDDYTASYCVASLLLKEEEWIKKERQQIIDAYLTNPLEAKWKNIGSDYYNETYGEK
jgi:hypothetical protein